jgi:uncharacterized membrane protein
MSVLYTLYDYETFLEMAGLFLLYFIPPAGKETIIPAAIALGIPWITVCLSVVFIDIACCLFLLWNFEVLGLIPIIGPRLTQMMRKGSIFLTNHPWLERFFLIGLIAFVLIPFQGTGAVSGTILGKMAGMPQIEIFFAITVGSTLQSFLIGLSVYALNKYLGLDLWYVVAFFIGIIVLFSIGTFIWYRLCGSKKNA